METDPINMIKIRTETKQKINDVSLQQNCLFICLFMSKNHCDGFNNLDQFSVFYYVYLVES